MAQVGCIVEKIDLIRKKLTEEIYFEVDPCVSVGPIANLKGPYFQPSLSVCVSVSDRHFYLQR